ncbi:MAG: hypothetical protein ACREQ9_05740, partial [Candidatus Binatia bacterium]
MALAALDERPRGLTLEVHDHEIARRRRQDLPEMIVAVMPDLGTRSVPDRRERAIENGAHPRALLEVSCRQRHGGGRKRARPKALRQQIAGARHLGGGAVAPSSDVLGRRRPRREIRIRGISGERGMKPAGDLAEARGIVAKRPFRARTGTDYFRVESLERVAPAVSPVGDELLEHAGDHARAVRVVELDLAVEARYVAKPAPGEELGNLDVGVDAGLEPTVELQDRAIAVNDRGVALLRAGDPRRDRGQARRPGLGDRLEHPFRRSPLEYPTVREGSS